MLIVSTVLSLSKKVWPRISELMVTEEGRSLEQMSSLAQYAFDAFKKVEVGESKVYLSFLFVAPISNTGSL